MQHPTGAGLSFDNIKRPNPWRRFADSAPRADGKSYQKQTAAHALAAQHHVAEKTIRNDAAYAQAIDTLVERVGPETRQALLARDTRVTQQDVKTLAKLATTDSNKAKEALEAVAGTKTPKQARKIVRDAAQHARAHAAEMDAIARSNIPEDEWPASLRPKPATTKKESTAEPRPDAANAGPATNGQPLPDAGFPHVVVSEPDTLESILKQVCLSLKALYWHLTPSGWLPLAQEQIDALAQQGDFCTVLGRSWRAFEKVLSTSEAFRLALKSQESPASATTEPETPPAQVAPGTIAEQLLAVLRAAPAGLTNAQLAKALGKKQTDTFRPLERLIKQGAVRKAGTTYVLVEQQESTASANGQTCVHYPRTFSTDLDVLYCQTRDQLLWGVATPQKAMTATAGNSRQM